MAKKGPFPEPMEKREKNCEFPPCHQEEPSLFTSDTSAEAQVSTFSNSDPRPALSSALIPKESWGLVNSPVIHFLLGVELGCHLSAGNDTPHLDYLAPNRMEQQKEGEEGYEKKSSA
ncbi:uncharacterized [Tachysurus ichikawai]